MPEQSKIVARDEALAAAVAERLARTTGASAPPHPPFRPRGPAQLG